MNYNTRGKNLLGIGLPNIYVHNIELSVSSDNNNNKTDNPHIVTGKQYSNYNSKTTSGLSNSGAMITNLNMSIKFSNLNPLLNPADNIKHIKVMVVQCLAKKEHDRINANPFGYFNSLIKNRGEKDLEMGSIRTKILPINQMLVHTYNRSVGIDLLGNKLVESNGGVIPYSLSTTRDSTSFYSIPIKSEFSISETEGGSEVSFLSYFVFSFYDKQSKTIESSAKIIPSLISDMFSIGKISSEVVISNKVVNRRSYAFKETSGTFWNGTVHQMGNGQWMRHSSHSGDMESSILDAIQVDNTKIRDNRIYSKLSSLKFDLVGNTEYISGNARLIDDLRKSSNSDLIKRKNNFLSEFYITRDKRNNARFMFSINMAEVVKKNTDFPKILDNLKSTDTNAFNRIIEQARIKNISVTRKRIRNSEMLTSRTELTTTIDDQETVIIAQSADPEQSSGGLIPSINSNSRRDPKGENLEPKTFGLIEEISLATLQKSKEIRSFTGTDFDISSKREGQYEYSLELETQDPIIPLLENNLASLQRIIEGSSTQPGFEQYYRDSLEVKSYYDSLVEQFNPSFLVFYNKKYNSSAESNYIYNNFIFRSLSFMTRLYYQLSNEFRSKKMTELSILNYLTNISSPSSGSPDGIQKVLQLMYSLESSLKKMIQKNTRYVKYKGDVAVEAVASSPTIQGTRSNRTHTAQHTFKNKFNAMTDPGVGYDFLFSTKDQMEDNFDGFALIDRDMLSERLSIETSKYFTSNNAGIEITDRNNDTYNKGDKIDNTKYSFLTVSNIFIKQEDENVSFSNVNSSLKSVNRKSLNDILTQVSLINQNKGLYYGSKTRPDGDKTEQNLVENLSVFHGATVGGNRENRKNSTSSRNLIFSENAKSNRIDDGERLFNRNGIETSERDLPKGAKELLTSINQVARGEFSSNTNSIRYYFVNDDEGGQTFKNQLVSNSDRNKNASRGQNVNLSPELNSAPNQLKALLLSLLKSDSVNKNTIFDNIKGHLNDSEDSFKDPLNAGLVFFNYKNIRKMEVFRGYRSQGNTTYIKSPIWTPLTKGDVDSAGTGKAILCRHTAYTNGAYGIAEQDNLSLPTYNEFFFVSQGLSGKNNTTAKGQFVLGNTLSTHQDNPNSNGGIGTKTTQFFNRRAKTTDPIRSKEHEAIRPEFMNSNIVIKDINLTKIGIRTTTEEAEILQSLKENENKTALELAKEVVKAGLGKFLPARFDRGAFDFAKVNPSVQNQTTQATSAQTVSQVTNNNLGGTSNY